jgi:hypothetical protein
MIQTFSKKLKKISVQLLLNYEHFGTVFLETKFENLKCSA